VSSPKDIQLERLFQRILLGSLGCLPFAFAACGDDTRAPVVEAKSCSATVPDVLITSVEGGAACYAFHEHPCGAPEGVVQADANCSFGLNDCQKLCPLSGAYVCNAVGSSCDDAGRAVYDGAFSVSCEFCPSNIGRRPAGLRLERGPRGTNAVGDHFARMSELEAASVTAFERLIAELTLHGAPEALIQDAERARRDEIRHAALTRGIARRFGGAPRALHTTAEPPRPLPEVARENAIEGCVRETYGALLAHVQARRALDPTIRSRLSGIAEDETRHANLSWAVDGWSRERLSLAARAELGRAVREAIDGLTREIAEPTADLARVAGLPSAHEQARLLDELRTGLWSV